MVAAKALPLFEEEAKERMREDCERAGRGGPQRGVARAPDPIAEPLSRGQAAALTGASPRRVSDAKKLLDLARGCLLRGEPGVVDLSHGFVERAFPGVVGVVEGREEQG